MQGSWGTLGALGVAGLLDDDHSAPACAARTSTAGSRGAATTASPLAVLSVLLFLGGFRVWGLGFGV